MKFVQFVLLIMLAAGLRVANAEVKKVDCPKNKNKTAWNQPAPESTAQNYLRVWDGARPATPSATPSRGTR